MTFMNSIDDLLDARRQWDWSPNLLIGGLTLCFLMSSVADAWSLHEYY